MSIEAGSWKLEAVTIGVGTSELVRYAKTLLEFHKDWSSVGKRGTCIQVFQPVSLGINVSPSDFLKARMLALSICIKCSLVYSITSQMTSRSRALDCQLSDETHCHIVLRPMDLHVTLYRLLSICEKSKSAEVHVIPDVSHSQRRV